MKLIKLICVSIIALMTLLWVAINVNALVSTNELFAWRRLLLQYSGILAMTVMSLGMVLAMRFTLIENKLEGLDKVYRLHKWLGIAALVFVSLHWILVNVPKWLVGAGLIIKPARTPRPIEAIDLFNFFNSQRGNAEQIGEYAFYVLIVLIIIALTKRFPYRYFFITHRWIALVYLSLVIHAVVLMSYLYWSTVLGIGMAILMLLGSFSAITSLFRRIGQSRKATGKVSSVSYQDGVKINAISVQLTSQWPGHEAGQFAFITFDQREGAHPFSITSVWQGDGKLSFLIKALGDYTSTISNKVKVGDVATIEGPYGRFNFDAQSKRQIWISGGIGITPFIARMKSLMIAPDGRQIDYFHSSDDADEALLRLLREDAVATGVHLHLMISPRDGRLSGAILRAKIADWKNADIWFCGPLAFGKAIRSDLIENGLPADQFHQELFDMR